MAGRSPAQRYWSDYDDAALLEIVARTLADMRSRDAEHRWRARQQLQELQTELRRRGVWRDKSSAC
jgi:hypothetical protein